MLIYSMGVSVDGFIADHDGGFEWTALGDELFRFRLAEASVGEEVAAALDATEKDVEIGGARRSWRRSAKTCRWS